LGASPSGLGGSEAADRLRRSGPNALKAVRRRSATALFFAQFRSPILLILVFATVVSALLRNYTDASIILLIVLLSSILTFVQEHRADRAVENLRDRVRVTVPVVRNGAPGPVPLEEVVPGDIVLLSAGSLVPADGLVLEAKDFFVNQAVLTGESFPVEKMPGPVARDATLASRTNCVFMGTNARSGTARMVVVQTGAATAFGQVARRLSLRPPENEFQRGVRRLGMLLAEMMFVLVFAVFAINVIERKPVLDSLLFSVALAVGLTPQLLPGILAISLARGAQEMARHGVIVRRLESIENFGSMDVLCTDKTGTLTEGVARLDRALDPSGAPSEDVRRWAWLNSRFQTGLANPLDEAVLAGAAFDLAGISKRDEAPYDFVRKRMSVAIEERGRPVLITKGQLAKVLETCSQVADQGRTAPLDGPLAKRLLGCAEGWGAEGFRVLGVATRELPPGAAYSRADEAGLTFRGFLLFLDPPKADVRETIADLGSLGVGLKIITGDTLPVTLHVARAIGLEVKGTLTGAELDALHDEALWQRAASTTLFAEVDPNQKERILLALKKTGHVVGYMGDGINDAPALHVADVGISVDQAVDVAKEAADFVLLRKDLSVLHRGIVQGRTTFANTLKYVFMATSANLGNMFSVAGASLFLPFLPMLPKQILLINLLTDLPEMAISGDNVDDDFVRRPHRWNHVFLRRFMIVFGLLSSVFDFLTFAALLWVFRASPELFRTGWFVESVLSAAVIVFAVRTRRPSWRSRPSRVIAAITLAVALVAVALPYSPLARPLAFVPLPLSFLGFVGGVIAVYFLSAELTKRIFYRIVGAP
jgi:Mg2+-importing ATPase